MEFRNAALTAPYNVSHLKDGLTYYSGSDIFQFVVSYNDRILNEYHPYLLYFSTHSPIMTNYSNLAGKFISAHPVQTQTQTVIPNTNTKPKLHSSEPECNNFHKGSHVIRKGEICEVIKVDYTVDPPALLVRTPDGREVATEIHLVQLHNEEYRVNAFLRQLGARCTSNNAGDGPQNSHRDNDQHNQCGECGDSKRHPDLRTHTAIKEKNQHSPH